MTSRQIRIGLVDMNHVCFAKKEMEIEREEDYRLTVRNIGTSIIELLEKNDLKADNCIGVGAGLPGTVDRKAAGEVVYRYIRSLCTGITNITNIFRPDLVLLSGNLFSKNEYLLEEIHSFIEKECFGRNGTGIPDIKAVYNSKNADLAGAANLIKKNKKLYIFHGFFRLFIV